MSYLKDSLVYFSLHAYFDQKFSKTHLFYYSKKIHIHVICVCSMLLHYEKKQAAAF